MYVNSKHYFFKCRTISLTTRALTLVPVALKEKEKVFCDLYSKHP